MGMDDAFTVRYIYIYIFVGWILSLRFWLSASYFWQAEDLQSRRKSSSSSDDWLKKQSWTQKLRVLCEDVFGVTSFRTNQDCKFFQNCTRTLRPSGLLLSSFWRVLLLRPRRCPYFVLDDVHLDEVHFWNEMSNDDLRFHT